MNSSIKHYLVKMLKLLLKISNIKTLAYFCLVFLPLEYSVFHFI